MIVFSIGDDKVQPIQVQVLLNEVRVTIELDSGSACCLISKSTFEKLFWPTVSERPELQHSAAVLRVYRGASPKIAGEIVTAKLEDHSRSCQDDIIIVEGDGPCLLDRNLIKKLELTNLAHIHMIYSTEHLKRQFPDVFSDTLGCLKGKYRI